MNMPLKSETLDAQASSACQHRQEARLPTAAELRQQFPADEQQVRAIAGYRDQIRAVLHGQDDRTLIVMGPCSIHDEQAALDYATRLKALSDEVSDRFLIVMRAYLEKPRTTVGWKGLLYDPERTGQGDLKQGLERSRKLLLALSELGLPLATEALSPFMMDYLGDLVSWTAIGARTTESQIHRE
ncbi:MAG: 3-deoxy-7-phosphoheptulonate synthase, partial [Pseudomonadota bacterium]|nr:3-deoxy-7-phosphoheptulonate synthase [Pseudomonadota bacterium]